MGEHRNLPFQPAEEYVPHPVPRAGVEKTGAGPAADPKAPFTGKWEQITYWLMANPKGAARTFSGNSNVAPQTCLQRKALRRSGPPHLWLIPLFVVA
jgi:hypothetical protein